MKSTTRDIFGTIFLVAVILFICWIKDGYIYAFKEYLYLDGELFLKFCLMLVLAALFYGIFFYLDNAGNRERGTLLIPLAIVGSIVVVITMITSFRWWPVFEAAAYLIMFALPVFLCWLVVHNTRFVGFSLEKRSTNPYIARRRVQ